MPRPTTWTNLQRGSTHLELPHNCQRDNKSREQQRCPVEWAHRGFVVSEEADCSEWIDRAVVPHARLTPGNDSQLTMRAEVFVDVKQIFGPVPVVAAGLVLDDRRYPHGIEA